MIVTSSPFETERLAAIVAARLRAGDFVGLRGDLGAGKTTFARGLLEALGYRGAVTSPTYTLVATYAFERNKTIGGAGAGNPNERIVVYHFDAYHAEKESAFLNDGGAELFGSEAICILEWPERALAFLPPSRVDINIEQGANEDSRIFTFSGAGTRGEELVRSIMNDLAGFWDVNETASVAGGPASARGGRV